MRYQSNKPKRQFLAGVSCPKCQAPESIVQIQVFEPEYDEYIECTECDHTEHRPSPESIQTMQENNFKTTNAGIKIVSITDNNYTK